MGSLRLRLLSTGGAGPGAGRRGAWSRAMMMSTWGHYHHHHYHNHHHHHHSGHLSTAVSQQRPGLLHVQAPQARPVHVDQLVTQLEPPVTTTQIFFRVSKIFLQLQIFFNL